MPRVPTVLLLVESSRSSGRSLLRGIAQYARHHGPWAFYWEPGGLEKVWPRLKTLQPQGIILRDVEKVEEVLATRVPAVVVGHSKSEIPGLANVITDSEAIGRIGANHLLAAGLRHFAFCGYRDAPWSRLRAESFRECLSTTGREVVLYRGQAGQQSWKTEQRVMANWLTSLPKPVGIMTCNDDRGRNVIEACKMAGLRVPDEVAILGADNDELVCELSDPPMSSVAINFERAGYESAELLHEMMAGKRRPGAKIIVHPTHVVRRQSTDILAVDDPAVAKGLRFVVAQAKNSIHVAEVVRASGVSRRVLEKRFRMLLGRSVLEEIRRVRVDQICRMLVETNEPISHIALSLGYEGLEHFARYFRRERHMTPLDFRKLYGHK